MPKTTPYSEYVRQYASGLLGPPDPTDDRLRLNTKELTMGEGLICLFVMGLYALSDLR